MPLWRRVIGQPILWRLRGTFGKDDRYRYQDALGLSKGWINLVRFIKSTWISNDLFVDLCAGSIWQQDCKVKSRLSNWQADYLGVSPTPSRFRHPGGPLPNFAQNDRVQEGLWSRGKTGSDAVKI